MSTIWTPHLTVAAIIEEGGRFLLVEEAPEGDSVFNQPAGHVEDGESIIDAVIRETLEETGRHFTPEALVGIYRWSSPHNGVTYLRAAFCGKASARDPQVSTDPDILANHWFDLDALRLRLNYLRSPLVMRGIEDYLHGKRLPLDTVQEL